MQRRSSELQLAFQEYLDVDWTHVKYYLRRQIAKCVNECKSQASHAKKLVGTIRHRPPNRPRVDPNADYEYNSDEFDDWDSDFDEDFDDESIEEATITIAPSATAAPNSVIETKMIKTEESVPIQNADPSSNVPIAQTVPFSATVASKPIKIENRSNYPRPPLKRPPSQPPPPPVPQLPSQETLEEYEIPISHRNSTILARKISLQESMLHSNFLSKENSSKPILTGSHIQETYEPVQPADENYEIVETPALPEKPILFPRNNGVPTSPSPPPLPNKPLKFQFAQSSSSNHDVIPAVSRPKLPVVDDNVSEGSGSLATFMNTILGRRSSTPSSSPKTSHRTFRDLSGNFSSADSQSSRSSSPEKDGLFMVGGSAFFSSSWSSDSKLTPPIPSKSKHTISDDIAQTLASRPLPPVPTVEERMQQKDLLTCPWFHEVERNDAEDEIKSLGVSGAFLVRPSKRAGKENPYTVTVLYEGKIFHLNIRHRPDNTYALGKEKKKEKTFPSIPDLIAYHQKEKILLTARGEAAGQTTLNAFPQK